MNKRIVWAMLGSLALVASATTTSSAATTSHLSTIPAAVPNVSAWCKLQGEAPFQLTKGGPLFAQAEFSGCSVPQPDLCHVTVILQRANPHGGSWSVASENDQGWGSCTGRFNTSIKCVQTGEKSTYNTQVILQVEYQSRISEAGIADSASVQVDC